MLEHFNKNVKGVYRAGKGNGGNKVTAASRQDINLNLTGS